MERNRLSLRNQISLLFVCFFSGVTLWAQATAQINGTVSDPTGALIPGVEVTATQTATGIGRSAITNERGAYVLPNLAIGPYRVEVSLPGFRTFVQNISVSDPDERFIHGQNVVPPLFCRAQ